MYDLKGVDLSEVTVLIIDDSKFSRRILRNLLGMNGISRVIEAESCATGMELWKDQAPDLILLDWVMPGIGGDQFLISVRSDKDMFLRTIPILVVTAHANKRNVIRAAKLGANGILRKPLSADILGQRIYHTLAVPAREPPKPAPATPARTLDSMPVPSFHHPISPPPSDDDFMLL